MSQLKRANNGEKAGQQVLSPHVNFNVSKVCVVGVAWAWAYAISNCCGARTPGPREHLITRDDELFL